MQLEMDLTKNKFHSVILYVQLWSSYDSEQYVLRAWTYSVKDKLGTCKIQIPSFIITLSLKFDLNIVCKYPRS